MARLNRCLSVAERIPQSPPFFRHARLRFHKFNHLCAVYLDIVSETTSHGCSNYQKGRHPCQPTARTYADRDHFRKTLLVKTVTRTDNAPARVTKRFSESRRRALTIEYP